MNATCPHCSGEFAFPEPYAGRESKCPHCEQLLTLPRFAPVAALVPQRPPPNVRRHLPQRQFENPYMPAHSNAPLPGRGGTILTFGILGLLVLAPFGVAAWIMGNTDLRMMDAGLMDDRDRSNTQTGRILGIIGTCFWILLTLIFFSNE